MATKFILHGGFPPKQKQEDDPFFLEILKDTPENTKILLCYFAKEKDRIPDNSREDIAQFEKNKEVFKSLSFEIADEEKFPEQIKNADVIYLHGGKTTKLLAALQKFPDLKELFLEKTVAADSAGVNSISSFCYSQSADTILEGVGIIPFKTICHYSEEFRGKADELNQRDDSSELLYLAENEYRVYYE